MAEQKYNLGTLYSKLILEYDEADAAGNPELSEKLADRITDIEYELDELTV